MLWTFRETIESYHRLSEIVPNGGPIPADCPSTGYGCYSSKEEIEGVPYQVSFPKDTCDEGCNGQSWEANGPCSPMSSMSYWKYRDLLPCSWPGVTVGMGNCTTVTSDDTDAATGRGGVSFMTGRITEMCVRHQNTETCLKSLHSESFLPATALFASSLLP